ncbi:MAG: rane protein of unknown function [Acidimicrobiales bacterium]|nr:rane protein of unknown function [Acidimicrobiales bacterium]
MAAGVAVRLVWIGVGSGDARFVFADSASYLDVAATLPGGFVSPSGEALVASLYRTPGYPAFLWLVGGAGHPVLAVVAQALLGGAATVWLGHRLTDRLIGPGAARLAALLLAFDPASVTHSLLIANETLTTTGLLISALGLHHLHGALRGGRRVRWAAVAAGASLGVVSLVRPSVAALPLVLGVVLWAGVRSRRALACGLVVAAVGLVPVAVLIARNTLLSGDRVLSTTQGQNVLDFGLAASVAAHHDLPVLPPDRDTMVRLTAMAYERDIAPADRAALDAAQARRGPVARALETNRLQAEIGNELLARHPGGAAVVAGQAAVRTFSASGYSHLASFFTPSRWQQVRVPVAASSAIWQLAFYAAIGVGTTRLAREGRWWVLALTLGFVTAYLVTSAGPWMYVRFRVPVTPFLAVLAAAGIDAVVGRAQHARGCRHPTAT